MSSKTLFSGEKPEIAIITVSKNKTTFQLINPCSIRHNCCMSSIKSPLYGLYGLKRSHRNPLLNDPVPDQKWTNRFHLLLHPFSLHVIYSAVLSKWDIFIKMRVAESLPTFDIEQSFINQKVLFLYKNNLLLSEKPSKVPFSMRIHGFMTFLILHFVSSKGERREKWQQGHKWAAAASALTLKLIKKRIWKGSAWKWTNWSNLCYKLWNFVKL